MPFINETVSDADIDHYGLPFHKGRLQYFTHDRESQRYLWGGMVGNPAYDDIRMGRFSLFTNNQLYDITIEPGEVTRSYKITPYKLEWKKIKRITPEPRDTVMRRQILEELKDALLVYGVDGRENKYTQNRQILFGF